MIVVWDDMNADKSAVLDVWSIDHLYIYTSSSYMHCMAQCCCQCDDGRRCARVSCIV